MQSNKKNLLAYACALAVALGVAQVSCSKSEVPTAGNSNSQLTAEQPGAASASADSQPNGAQSISADEMQNFKNLLADVSNGVGQLGKTNAAAAGRRLLVFEEKHTSVASQFEIALMLLRLHQRHGLRHVALEGLTEDKKFPDTQWFRSLGASKDDDVVNEVLVGMLRDGEISAVELIATAFPDVTVHAADDAAAYGVALSKQAGLASPVYLYKIGMKSVRPEHYARLNQLNQQHKISELLEFVIAQDAWAKERQERMKKSGGDQSIEQVIQDLREIEERARAVNAELTPEERSAMSEAKAFFDAADKRTHTLVRVALGVEPSAPLVAVNIGAAHTEGVERLLDRGKVTYAVLTPLSHLGKKTSGDLSYESFERKDLLQSVAWTGKGLGSLLDGRRKPPPVVGQDWFKSLSQLRVATILLVRGTGGAGFPDPNLKRRIDSFDHLRVNWESLAITDGGLTFDTSVNGRKGWTSISVKAGKPLVSVTTKRGATLEELLLRDLESVRKEPGERTEPKGGPVIEPITPDVLAAYAKESAQLKEIRVKI